MRTKTLLLLGVLMSALAFAEAAKPYKVVFDLTTNDPADAKALMRWIKEISSANPKTEMEVVMYAKGIELVVTDKTQLGDDVKEAIAAPNVKFKVCEAAMKNQSVEKAQLLAKVETVPDGIGEIVAKQKAGWGYIKVVGPR